MRRTTATRSALAAAGVLALTALAMPSTAGNGRAAAAPFGAPVKVTPANGGGYEPTILADRFVNLYATAHKENAELAV